jgi:hypothetical protein
MLSERERRVLDSIEADLSADRRFVAAMRSGRPQAYGRRWTIVLTVVGVLAFGMALTTGEPVAVIVLVAVAIATLVRSMSPRLDSA